jgi:hypothetical protein
MNIQKTYRKNPTFISYEGINYIYHDPDFENGDGSITETNMLSFEFDEKFNNSQPCMETRKILNISFSEDKKFLLKIKTKNLDGFNFYKKERKEKSNGKNTSSDSTTFDNTTIMISSLASFG